MYEKPEGLWGFGTWVNGGHWSTCEARMVLAYYRLGQFEDARRSMRQLLTFAERFRMDNPLTKCGSDVYQPNQPINLCYDTFGPAAALMRGLFEYLYRADGLTLVPHMPPGITELEQRDPVRFGNKRILLVHRRHGADHGGAGSTGASGSSSTGRRSSCRTARLRTWPEVQIVLGDAKVPGGRASARAQATSAAPDDQGSRGRSPSQLAALEKRAGRLREFERRLVAAGMGASYEAAHARLAAECVAVAGQRLELLEGGKIKPLASCERGGRRSLLCGHGHQVVRRPGSGAQDLRGLGRPA